MSGGLGSRTTTRKDYWTAAEIAESVPRYADEGSRMAILARGFVEERAGRVRAEEALRHIRWLPHDDTKTFKAMFYEAVQIAGEALAAVPEENER